MSHRTFSMGVFPIVFWKNTASILMAGIILKRGSISSSLPNLATWPGSCVRQCCHNMTWAWSWRFSIWLGSLSPLVSENTNVIARHSHISLVLRIGYLLLRTNLLWRERWPWDKRILLDRREPTWTESMCRPISGYLWQNGRFWRVRLYWTGDWLTRLMACTTGWRLIGKVRSRLLPII